MADQIEITVTLEDELRVEVELPLVVSSGSVSILDQEGNVVEVVPSGDTYTVLVISGIHDNGGPYTNSIIDPGP